MQICNTFCKSAGPIFVFPYKSCHMVFCSKYLIAYFFKIYLFAFVYAYKYQTIIR